MTGLFIEFSRNQSVINTFLRHGIMKEGIHPDYREVVFQDMASGFKFITRSTVNTREKVTMDDGKEYPLFKLDVTSESHPFYTGAQQRISEAGRVEKFRQKFARGTKAGA